MRQIFHHYKEWEDFKSGMWRVVDDGEFDTLFKKCVEFMGCHDLYGLAMIRVINEWPKACEHNLTNMSVNRKAWVGQAACQLQINCPEYITRSAWGLLTEYQQKEANRVADIAIKPWETNFTSKGIMSKIGLGINVFEAAKERISWTFDTFDKISVSFSGGKDSTIMLHMVMDEAIKRNQKVAVLFIDLEGQYKLTIDHIQQCYDMYEKHIEPFWVCLPIHLRNAVSVYETHWKCWDRDKEKSWIRKLPLLAINDDNYFPFFHDGMEFEEFVPEFSKWYAGNKTCAVFVGIRTDESLNRYRTIASSKKAMYEDKKFTTQVTENSYNIYPIYDWKTSDIWVYHYKNPLKPHNRLYDLMYKAGLTISQMRICQPYGDDQRRGLWLFHLIEPETWARVVARVNGANSGSLYVQESGNVTGYRKISKPPQHTWKSFAELLINSMPPKTKLHYENKIILFCKWWMDRGYPEGIPDEADYKLEADRRVPSWRRVCKSILRNDYWAKGLGFSQHKSEAYENYLKLMKTRKDNWQINSLEDVPTN
jgi:predicted phosphoadenosine phosphosulfate sulfurtransferase